MKRIVNYLLVLAMLLNGFAVFAEEASSDVAEAVMGKSLKQTGFKTVETGTNTKPIVAVRGNSECWLMDKQAGDSSAYINFSLADKFKHKKQDGSVYEISVEYYDTGNRDFKSGYGVCKIF